MGPSPQELQIAGVNFKAFDLGGHEIARKVWKDYYAKVHCGGGEEGHGGPFGGGGGHDATYRSNRRPCSGRSCSWQRCGFPLAGDCTSSYSWDMLSAGQGRTSSSRMGPS
jgi:hypothetical protein